MEVLTTIMDWSEVWILIVPMVIYLNKKAQPNFMVPVITYVFLGFFFNLICDGMYLLLPLLPEKYHSNTIFYNLHSLSRFCLFISFFLRLNQQEYKLIKKLLIAFFIINFIIYFIFFDSFFNTQHISSDLMTGEAFFLLFFCMLFYLSLMKEENSSYKYRNDFWVVTGLSIYMVVNFFLFLFYNPLLDKNAQLAEDIWNVHNIAYVIFILLISKALYVSDPDKH